MKRGHKPIGSDADSPAPAVAAALSQIRAAHRPFDLPFRSTWRVVCKESSSGPMWEGRVHHVLLPLSCLSSRCNHVAESSLTSYHDIADDIHHGQRYGHGNAACHALEPDLSYGARTSRATRRLDPIAWRHRSCCELFARRAAPEEAEDVVKSWFGRLAPEEGGDQPKTRSKLKATIQRLPCRSRILKQHLCRCISRHKDCRRRESRSHFGVSTKATIESQTRLAV